VCTSSPVRPFAQRPSPLTIKKGQAARGATAYVTLEPCNHYGRTPPCSQALVEAGVARVRAWACVGGDARVFVSLLLLS
jgi:pyrimidine deaminase RibD-like protein